MPIIVRRVKVRRRKPGERADLNVEKVIVAASDVLEELGLENFSGRAVAKKLRVSSAAIYLHIDGGLRGLKVAMARQILSEVARPYRPTDTPTGYLLDLALRFLKAIHRRQAIAQLVACELTSDYLLCPQFTERVLSVLTRSVRKDRTAAQKLDLVMAALVGMALVESCAAGGGVTKTLAADFMARLKALEADEIPTLFEQSGSLMTQIKRRLVSSDSLLRETARRHMDPVIAALALGDG